MLDLRLRPLKERATRGLAGRVARWCSAGALTAASLGLALGAAAAAATGLPLVAVVGWLASRLLDGLDGPVARARGEASDLGGYLDVVGDTVGYAAIPLGVAVGIDGPTTWVAVACLEAVLYVNAISWTFLAAVLEKRGAGATSRGELTTVTMPPAVVEGTETIVLYAVMLAVPAWATAVCGAMAALVALNVVQRLMWARRHLRS